jgi:rRNA maturation endonuclease Nob1
VITELSAALSAALETPDVATRYECTHCGTVVDEYRDDCPRCGGAVMRIVTDARDGPIDPDE